MDDLGEIATGKESNQTNATIIKTLDNLLHNPSTRNPEALGVARYRNPNHTTEVTIGVATSRDEVVEEFALTPKTMLIQPPVYSIAEADTRKAPDYNRDTNNKDFQYIIANGKLFVRHVYYFFSSGGLAKKVVSIRELQGSSPLGIFEEDGWDTEYRQQVPISPTPLEEGDQITDLTEIDYEKINRMLTNISSGELSLHTSATIQELHG